MNARQAILTGVAAYSVASAAGASLVLHSWMQTCDVGIYYTTSSGISMTNPNPLVPGQWVSHVFNPAVDSYASISGSTYSEHLSFDSAWRFRVGWVEEFPYNALSHAFAHTTWRVDFTLTEADYVDIARARWDLRTGQLVLTSTSVRYEAGRHMLDWVSEFLWEPSVGGVDVEEHLSIRIPTFATCAVLPALLPCVSRRRRA